jgi:hypothetical protein
MCGVALATAGFIIATKDFEVPYKEVLMHHGTLGVAILVLVYVQVRCSSELSITLAAAAVPV